jgi:hypothetical protein
MEQQTKAEAIVTGITFARENHLNNPYDVAICVSVALADAGYRIVRAPKACTCGDRQGRRMPFVCATCRGEAK